MEERELVEHIYDHVEAGHVDKAVFACLRLARKLNDTFNVVTFLRELYPDRKQFGQAFYEETKHLNKEARNFVWEKTGDAWIEERALDYSVGSDDDQNVLALGVGDLQREPDQMEKAIEDLQLPQGMGEFDTAAFTDRHTEMKSGMRLKAKACDTVIERIRTRCHYYASRVEGQLDAQARTTDVLGRFQIDVNNYFAARCDSTYRKLIRASSLVDSTNPEDHSLLLTAIRRAVKSAADYWYPPVDGAVMCHDGVQRQLGDGQYLNRLQEFCARRFSQNASSGLLQEELSLLAEFVRRINIVASKGVHAEVSQFEARQGILGLYLFLSNLIAKIEHDQG